MDRSALPEQVPASLGRYLVGDGVLLIGDAAGLAYPESGEGIRPAIESGLLAAGVILAHAGRTGRDALEPYRQALEGRFGRPDPRRTGSGPLNGLKAVVAGRLLATRWFTRRILLERWFLHTHEPPLGGS